jgi:hypothetical protein
MTVWSPRMLSLLRIVAALLFMEHGLMKLALLAEARQAYQELLASSAGSMTEVARNAKRCRKRLGRLMQIALLAPDIVQRCLEGTQPLALTTTKILTTDLPVCRRVLVCPSISSPVQQRSRKSSLEISGV